MDESQRTQENLRDDVSATQEEDSRRDTDARKHDKERKKVPTAAKPGRAPAKAKELAKEEADTVPAKRFTYYDTTLELWNHDVWSETQHQWANS